MKKLRCAIYTRKSSEEGLEQNFNSLDAQREACAAYILSQAGEGWVGAKDIYDDGGFSGGSMERPALKRLMAEVEAKRIDVIVVYKSRSPHPLACRFRAHRGSPRPYGRIVRLDQARRWTQMLASGEAATLNDLARTENLCPHYTGQLLPLAFLAPVLVADILDGRQPARLTLATLIARPLPSASPNNARCLRSSLERWDDRAVAQTHLWHL